MSSCRHVLLLPGPLPDFHPLPPHISLLHHQLYAVENWILARSISPCLLVYTANPAHSVSLLPQTPSSDAVWHSTLAQLTAHGARQKQTPHGTLIITSLAHFRSDYTIVHIPAGSFHDVRDQLYANIDLLRTASNRRTALTLEDPSDSTRHRFLDAYRLPDPSTDYPSKPFLAVVLELVKLIQAALALFGMYPTPSSTTVPPNLLLDGLLCDNTLQGIHTWISTIGSPCLGLPATERVADPPFVSAILSLVLCVRNRLAYLGYALPRDPFLYPYQFSNALSLFIQSTAPVPPQPPSHHRTFSSPYHAAVHTTTPIIPAAPPPTSILSASAAAAAAAPYSQSQPQAQPANPILTRELIESISTAYSAKLKIENRKVRRVIKNRLAATPSPIPSSTAGVDSDGTGDVGHESPRESRRHTLSLSLSLTGGSEGPGASLDRASVDQAQSAVGSGTGVGGVVGSTVGSIGSSGGQLLSGIGSSLASGLGLGSNNVCAGSLAELTVPTLDLTSFTSFGPGTRNAKRREKKSRKSHAEAGCDNNTGDYLSAAGGGGLVGGASTPSSSVYHHQDKERERDTVVGGTIEALWSGRIADLLRIREEAEAFSSLPPPPSQSQPPSIPAPPALGFGGIGLGWAPSPALGGSTSISAPGQRPHRRRLHRASDSLSALGEKEKWAGRSKDKSPLPAPAATPAPAAGGGEALGSAFSLRTKVRPGHPASDGDNDHNDGSSYRSRERRYDGRSTEEESDVFGVGGNTGASPSPSFGGMWGGRVRGKLGSWAGLTKKKPQGQGRGSSVDLGTPPPLSLSASSSKTKDSDTVQNQNHNQNQNETTNPIQRSVSASATASAMASASASGAGPTPLPKLVITHNTGSRQGSTSSRPSVSRRLTMPGSVSGPQSPTLPPMVFSGDAADDEDDDDLLSSGQISPLSDYRPSPFNMLSSTSNLNLNALGPNGTSINTTAKGTGTGISPEVYERTLMRLLHQRRRPSRDGRVPQSARVASWADPLSASVRSDEEMDEDVDADVDADAGMKGEGEDDDVDDDEAHEQGEGEPADELEEDVLSIASTSNLGYPEHQQSLNQGVRGPPRPRPRQIRSRSGSQPQWQERTRESEAEETMSDVSRSRIGSMSIGMGMGIGGVAKFKGKGREKARFHSLLSVLDGEGVLVEEPMEESEYDGYGYGYDEDGGEFSEDGERYERESGFRRRRGARFDPRRRRSFHDLESFRDVEVLTPERMKIDVDLCGHILIMWRREEHLRNVIACVRLITQSLSKTNMSLREHYETHLPTLDEISTSTSILGALDTEHSRSLKILQSTNTLEYESAQFLVDELWQTASPSRRKVLALRDKVFNGTGGRRLPAGVHGAHGPFNRLQWTLDGRSRLVDYLGRTESEAEEEKRLEDLSAGVRGHGHPGMFVDAHEEEQEEEIRRKDEETKQKKKEAEEAEANVGVVEHPAIKPVWLLRFFTSWGARWSAAAATTTTPTPTTMSAATSPPATRLQSPANEKESSSEPERLRSPRVVPPTNRQSPIDDERTESNLARSLSH